jgi:RNA polymerase sigma factor (TIGR02999 family)
MVATGIGHRDSTRPDKGTRPPGKFRGRRQNLYLSFCASFDTLSLLPLPRAANLPFMSDLAQILNALEQGDPKAAEQLLPLVYDELRALAAQQLAREKPGQTLQATALVHEAYLKLLSMDKARQWNDRGHFFAAAAEAMRRILVDAARRKRSLRRGGLRQRFDLSADDALAVPLNDELLDLDEALSKLATEDPPAAELVKLRLFGGMTIEEAAQYLEVSPRTVKRTWAYARAWLGRALADNVDREE